MSSLSSRQTLHPDSSNANSNRASRVESSYAGSLYDMYIGTGENIEFGSPGSDTRRSVLPPTTRASRMPEPRRHIEVTERADGSVVWQVIAGLADRGSVYSDFNPRHTRTFSDGLLPTEDGDAGEETLDTGAAGANGGIFRTPAGLTDDDSRSFFTRPRGGHRKSFSFDAAEPPLPDLPAFARAQNGAGTGVQQDVFEIANPSSTDTGNPLSPTYSGSHSSGLAHPDADAGEKTASPTRIVYHNDAQLASLLNVLARGKDSAKFEFHIASPNAAPAVLETWLGGQAGGSATAYVLTGATAPGGRLAETIPHRLEDTPAFGNFPGEHGHVRYGERVLVGYRWYDTRDTAVAYPFGHGLTYTTFAYDEVSATVSGAGDDLTVDVSVRITNTGAVAGAEVVQVYVRDPSASVVRPPRELKGFRKIRLAPGSSETVTFTLGARDLSYWHPVLRRWIVEGGNFVVEVGASSRDIRGTAGIDVEGESAALPLDSMSTVAEWLAHPVGGPLLRAAMAAAGVGETDDEMLRQIPLEVAISFAGGVVGPDDLAQLVAAANA